TDQEIRRGGLPVIPGVAAREAGRSEAPPRRRGAPRQLPDAGVHRADPQVQCCGRVRRARDLPRDRRRDIRFRLSAPAEGEGHDQDRLSAEGIGRLGQAPPDVCVRWRSKRPGSSRSETRRADRTPGRVRLRDPGGQGARARRRNGADWTIVAWVGVAGYASLTRPTISLLSPYAAWPPRCLR